MLGRSWFSARTALAGVVLAFSAVSASAQSSQVPDQAVFAFGGAFISGGVAESLIPVTAPYEDNHILGVGYQKTLGQLGTDLSWGVEAGLATRLGHITSAEAWAGLMLRYDGFTLGDRVRISPSFTAGLSAVTDPIGVERDREIEHNGDATLLFYLGPEVSVTSLDNPNVEAFWRVHHRSGAWGSMGNMGDAANANVVGVRWHF